MEVKIPSPLTCVAPREQSQEVGGAKMPLPATFIEPNENFQAMLLMALVSLEWGPGVVVVETLFWVEIHLTRSSLKF